ncbi:MAG: ribosome assembly RNA-binding protein YhbY [Bradymonadia bacterium]
MQSGLIQKLSSNLQGWQRRQLRGMAHAFKPIVQVGHAGVSDQLVEQLNTALYDHELVKVKIVNTCEDAIEDVATALTQATQSACVQQIGHILLFYKANPDEPRIVFVKHPTPSR